MTRGGMTGWGRVAVAALLAGSLFAIQVPAAAASRPAGAAVTMTATVPGFLRVRVAANAEGRQVLVVRTNLRNLRLALDADGESLTVDVPAGESSYPLAGGYSVLYR